MANITIIKAGDAVRVDFGDYYGASPLVDYKKATYQKYNIDSIGFIPNDCILIKMRNLSKWKVGAVQGADNFVIDTIDGIAPTDLDHLYTLLSQLSE